MSRAGKTVAVLAVRIGSRPESSLSNDCLHERNSRRIDLALKIFFDYVMRHSAGKRELCRSKMKALVLNNLLSIEFFFLKKCPRRELVQEMALDSNVPLMRARCCRGVEASF